VAEVPKGLASDTLDPLAALLRVRAWLDQAPEGYKIFNQKLENCEKIVLKA